MADTVNFAVTDPNFCVRCGTVLPVPTAASNKVTCKRCKHSVDISVFDGIVVNRSVVFNRIADNRIGTDMFNTAGPSIDRTCSECGNPSMTYKTQQTRSADEGQTVFFSCPKCGNQEIEYS